MDVCEVEVEPFAYLLPKEILVAQQIQNLLFTRSIVFQSPVPDQSVPPAATARVPRFFLPTNDFPN
jgi:hypothetical protein